MRTPKEHWDALQEITARGALAAEELAAQMVNQATTAPGIQPWNPLEDPAAATARAEQVHEVREPALISDARHE